MNLVQIHLYVSGKVQGVGFRYATLRTAKSAHIVGWVRNTPDGRVEIHAQGESQIIDPFLAWCHRGPALSKVDQVTVESYSSIKEISFNTFEIR